MLSVSSDLFKVTSGRIQSKCGVVHQGEFPLKNNSLDNLYYGKFQESSIAEGNSFARGFARLGVQTAKNFKDIFFNLGVPFDEDVNSEENQRKLKTIYALKIEAERKYGRKISWEDVKNGDKDFSNFFLRI